MEAAAEAAKGEIIRIMNRLSDVRSQQARLSAMKAALEQQISGMDQTSLRDQEGLDALSRARPGGPGSAGRGKAGRLTELKGRMESMAKSVQEAAEEGKRLETEFTQARDKRQQCASRLKLLQEMQRDYEGLNNSVKQVLHAGPAAAEQRRAGRGGGQFCGCRKSWNGPWIWCWAPPFRISWSTGTRTPSG